MSQKISPWTYFVFGTLLGTAVLNGLVLYFALESKTESLKVSEK